MATKPVAPSLALAAILFATLLVFHECSEVVMEEEGSTGAVKVMKGRVLRGAGNFKRCVKGTDCPSGNCWCCPANWQAKACMINYKACIGSCSG